MNNTVLLIDDHQPLHSLLGGFLGAHGFELNCVGSLTAGRKELAARTPAMVLLDLILPDGDGLDLARELRQREPTLPIIMLSVRTQESDRVTGLETGADDYLPKPFSPRELLARMRAVIRRCSGSSVGVPQPGLPTGPRAYRFGAWRLDVASRRLIGEGGLERPLTRTEFKLLHVLCRAPNRILTREQLINAIGFNENVLDRSVNVQVVRLRRKLRVRPGEPELVRTERGLGYVFDASVEPQW